MTAIAYVNGTFVPQSEAKISIMDRGFLFADGIYEVSAVIDGKLVDNDLHMARLERSVGEIGLPLPETSARISELMKELVAKNKLMEGLVYLQVTRGAEASRNFAFPKETKPSLVMFCDFKTYLDTPTAKTGIRVKTVEDIRWARRDIKSVALLAQVLAKQAAAADNCQEAWMHEDGVVTEGGSSTAYIVVGEGANAKIITRENSRKILPGCTRRALLDLLAETGMPIEERAFTVEEAYNATEAFITSATSFVMPVTEIDNRKIGGGQVGPVARRFRELYIAHARK
ncbi:MAG: D-amino-acid transaminase [Beijerinckiaceae bacterium]